jgi:TRAP-type C4-dicarboxylate transport system substrate-binding protein
VQKYVAMTGHIWDGHYIFANLARWNGLPEDVRKVMLQHLSEAAERERADILRLNTGLVENLTKAGITFNEPDKQAFRDALKAGGFYGEWKEKFGPEAWGLLEKYAGPL